MDATPFNAGGWSPGASATTLRLAIDATLTSWADLAAVATTGLALGTTRVWVESSTGILKAAQLKASTAATDTASGLQRPSDYNGSTNAKVWHGIAL